MKFSFVCIVFFFFSSKASIQIKLSFFLLVVLIVMVKILRQLNINSMSICSVGFGFVLLYVWSFLNYAERFNERKKNKRHFLLLFSLCNVDRTTSCRKKHSYTFRWLASIIMFDLCYTGKEKKMIDWYAKKKKYKRFF